MLRRNTARAQYTGGFKRDKFDGRGELKTRTGTCVQPHRTPQGVVPVSPSQRVAYLFVRVSGLRSRYVGEFQDGLKHGSGVQTFRNGGR